MAAKVTSVAPTLVCDPAKALLVITTYDVPYPSQWCVSIEVYQNHRNRTRASLYIASTATAGIVREEYDCLLSALHSRHLQSILRMVVPDERWT